MVNRNLALFFLLLANIVLLAHAFIPHHHHDDQICLASSHCQSESHDHHFCANPHHGHDSQRSSDCCSLKQVIILPGNQLKSDCKFVNTPNNHRHSNDFQAAILPEKCCCLSVLEIFAKRQDQVFQFYDRPENHSLQLRAPPVV